MQESLSLEINEFFAEVAFSEGYHAIGSFFQEAVNNEKYYAMAKLIK